MPADAPAPDGRQPVVRIKTPEEGCTSWKEPELLGWFFLVMGWFQQVCGVGYFCFIFFCLCFSDGDV